MNAWTILLVVYAAVFISSPLIVILHELGHAFAYMVFTKPGKIDIYIGSYAEKTKNINVKTGKLHFHIKKSFPFVKSIGLCSSDTAETNYVNYIIILLAGTCFTFFFAVLLGTIVYYLHAPLMVQIFFYIFLGFSVLSLIGNLVPRNLKTGSAFKLESDGTQIALMLKIKSALPLYIEAREHFNKKEFITAIEKLKAVLQASPNNVKMLRLIIMASINSKKCDNAGLYLTQLEAITELTTEDLFNRGCIYSLTKKHHEAIETYNKVLKSNRNHINALNNMGGELAEQGAHEVALRVLERAIKINPEYVFPYVNLAYSKILQGDFDSAKVLIDKCFELDAANAEVFKMNGIYYLKLKNINAANTNFNKALELNPDIDISDYVEELKQLTAQEA